MWKKDTSNSFHTLTRPLPPPPQAAHKVSNTTIIFRSVWHHQKPKVITLIVSAPRQQFRWVSHSSCFWPRPARPPQLTWQYTATVLELYSLCRVTRKTTCLHNICPSSWSRFRRAIKQLINTVNRTSPFLSPWVVLETKTRSYARFYAARLALTPNKDQRRIKVDPLSYRLTF